MKGLTGIPYNNSIKLASFDITNIFTTIPKKIFQTLFIIYAPITMLTHPHKQKSYTYVPLSLIKTIFNFKTPFSYKTQV